MADSLLTPTFRLSFPQLFEPKSFKNGDPKFSLVMLFEQGTDISTLKAAAKAVAINKWGADKLPANLTNPFRDGSEKEHLDGYEAGVTFVGAKANAEYPPDVVDHAKQEIIVRKEIYAGCYCRAVVTPFAYDAAGNKGVSFGLRAVQKVGDGPSFGGGGSELFDELPVSDTTTAAPASQAGDDFLA